MNSRTRRPPFPALLACVLTIALAAALAPSHPALAQGLNWNDISGPMGYSALYTLADGTLYAINGNTLYRSFDAGDSWQNFPRPGGPILEFAARGSTTVIAVQTNAANFKQYFVSTDRGDSWTRINAEPSPVHTNLMLSADEIPYALYPVASKMAVERLQDGAWQRLGVATGVYSNPASAPRFYTVSAIDDQGTIYIGTRVDGIHSSRDSARTWTKDLPYRYVSSISFAPDGRAAIGTAPNNTTAGGVFTSGDHGATWNLAGLTDVSMAGFQYDLAGNLIVLGSGSAGDPTRVYLLRNGAAAWDSSAAFDFDYEVLAITPSGKYIATSPGVGFLTSTDGGSSWQSDGVRLKDIFSLATAPDGSLLAGTVGQGLFRSTDAGSHWGRIAGAGMPSYFYAFTLSGAGILAGTERGLYGSSDNGGSWTPLSATLNGGTGDLPVYAVLVDGSGDLFIGTAAGLFASRDGGATWDPAGLGSSTIRGLALSNTGVLYAATGSEGVFASADGGVGWSGLGLARPDIQTVAVNDAGEVFVGASQGLYLSTDGGQGWTQKVFSYGHVHSILFNGNFNVYAASSYGLFVSSDAGQSWASAGLDGLFVVALAYDASHALLAGVYKGGVGRSSQVITAVSDGPGLPSSASISQNYPNPFNPVTTIDYHVPGPSAVTLRVYDLLGRVSETIVSGHLPPGTYHASWDAGNYPSGVYFYAITIVPESPQGAVPSRSSWTEVRKMVLMR